MKITRAVVPSLFTVLNMFCGFLSLLYTSKGEYSHAAWFIIIAGAFDVLDGVMARITKSSSDFGVELDSLSDIISFGVAPSFLVYKIHLYTFEGTGILLSAMPMVFGAMRLARFNVQLVAYDKDYFKGLPIPSVAIAICSFILTYFQDGVPVEGIEASVIAPMVAILSLLMVSTIKYDTIPKFSKRAIVQHPLRFTIGIIGLTAIVITKGRALFPFFVFYIATGPIRYIFTVIHHAFKTATKKDDEETEMTSVDM